MNKVSLCIKGYISCFGWMITAVWKWILEQAPELAPWKKYSNLEDHLWYAERLNGRLAMIGWVVMLFLFLNYEFKF